MEFRIDHPLPSKVICSSPPLPDRNSQHATHSGLCVRHFVFFFWGGGWEPGGVLLGILGGGVAKVLQILTRFQTKKCHFPHPFSDLASKIHTCFQTGRWSQNSTLQKNELFHIYFTLHVYIKQKLCHHC